MKTKLREFIFVLMWGMWAGIISVLSVVISPIIIMLFKDVKFDFKLEETVCFTLYKKGYITTEQYQLESELAGSLSSDVLLGYSVLIAPILSILQKTPYIDTSVSMITRRWIKAAKYKTLRARAVLFIAARIGQASYLLSLLSSKNYFPVIIYSLYFLFCTQNLITQATIASLILILFIWMEISSTFFGREVTHSTFQVLFASGISILGYITCIIFPTSIVLYLPTLGYLPFLLSHELGHKKERQYKTLASIINLLNLFPQFMRVHNQIHHKHVCSVKDAGSSQGRPFFTFFVQQLHTYRKFLRPLEIIGIVAIIAIFPQSILLGGSAYLFLEIINYHQHLTLVRGTKEKITAHHSWDTYNVLSNNLLYNLGRHGEHHSTSSAAWHSDLKFKSNKVRNEGYLMQIVLYTFLLNPYKVRETA